ncbi:HAAS signaling domain-containing protein [Kitasatospora setae]|uniref:HAAS signaling domain-containing protein n=1 Tax=Kitasatospora setae TaxID=2066 RepID=UPI0038B36F57
MARLPRNRRPRPDHRREPVNTPAEHPLVRAHLTAVERHTAPLAPERRRELLADLREHVEVALAENGDTGGAPDDDAVRYVLGQLGTPREIADAALAEDGRTRPEPESAPARPPPWPWPPSPPPCSSSPASGRSSPWPAPPPRPYGSRNPRSGPGGRRSGPRCSCSAPSPSPPSRPPPSPSPAPSTRTASCSPSPSASPRPSSPPSSSPAPPTDCAPPQPPEPPTAAPTAAPGRTGGGSALR